MNRYKFILGVIVTFFAGAGLTLLVSLLNTPSTLNVFIGMTGSLVMVMLYIDFVARLIGYPRRTS